jgi:hypothetical protein
MRDNDFAPTILTSKIRHEVFESPPPGLNDFKFPESLLSIGSFLTGTELSLEGSLPQQRIDFIKTKMIKLYL